MSFPDALRIQEVEALSIKSKKSFDKLFGIELQDADFNLHLALKSAYNMFSSITHTKHEDYKRIWLFTCDDRPNQGRDNMKKFIRQRVEVIIR